MIYFMESLILFEIFFLLKQQMNTNQNICLRNDNWFLFIFHIINCFNVFFCNYFRINFSFKYWAKFDLSLLQITSKLGFLWNFPLMIPKNELINRKKHNSMIIQNCGILKGAILTKKVLIILIVLSFEKICNSKQQKKVSNSINKVFGPILWMNVYDNSRGIVLRCDRENIDQGRSYVDRSINISNCIFSRTSIYSGDGGVIYVYGGSYSMNLNYSVFYKCACSNNGGAIYYYSSNSFLRMICANRCYCGASSYYLFAHLGASQMNHVEYLSVSYSSDTAYGFFPIYMSSGDQQVDNTNSSLNNVLAYSGIDVYSPSSFTSTHCTFSNNKVSDSICIYFYSTSGMISMSYANIVHNNSPSMYGVILVEGVGSRKLMYCIFYCNQNFLFCVLTGSLEVSHSFIDHSSSSFSSRAVSITNNSLTLRMTYQIQFFNSLHCYADIPFIESKKQNTIDQTYTKSITFINTFIIMMYY